MTNRVARFLLFPNWTSTGLNMPRMFKDRPGDDPTRRSFAGEGRRGEEVDRM